MSTPSPYLDHLPEVFRNPPGPSAQPFLGEFLKIFEALLSGRNDATPPAPPNAARVRGLEEILAAFVNELDPASTTVVRSADGTRLDSPFLAYLASWVALTLDQNWDLDRKRRWLQRIVLLYQRRGTRAGLEEYLAMFVGDRARISEPPGGFTLAAPGSTTLGVDTFLAGAAAYYFRVGINYGFPPEAFVLTEWLNIQKGTRAIIDLEKPAHTYYTLDTRTPGIILNVAGHNVVGRETLIWQNSKPL
jgi:phage tail-like protein